MTSPVHASFPTPIRILGFSGRLALWGLIALITLMALTLAPAHAQPRDAKVGGEAPVDVSTALDALRAQMDSVQKSLKEPQTDAELVDLRATAQAAQAKADAAAAAIAPQLTSVQARLAQLGVPSTDTPEAADVAAQRTELTKSSSKLDAQNKLARLISVEAGQAAEQILSLRRSQFQARMGERTDSILGEPFWAELHREWPKDARRLKPLRTELTAVLAATPLQAWVGIFLAIVLILGLRVFAGRALIRLTTTRVPPGRLRRSLFAMAVVLLSIATPGLIADALRIGLARSNSLSDAFSTLLDWVLVISCYGGLIAGLGSALLAPVRPSWRLPPILDTVALSLGRFPLILAIVVSIGWFFEELAKIINASLAATVTIECFMALALAVTMAAALLRASRLRRRHKLDPESTQSPASPLWLTALFSLAWLVLVGGVICVLTGFVAFGSFVIKQMVWYAVVLSAMYLLTVLIHDGCVSLLASIRHNAEDEHLARPLTRARSQAVVVLSGLGRLGVVLLAVAFLLAPFGEGPAELLSHIDYLHAGISIGEVQIRPTSVLQSAVVLLLGFGCVRILQRWLAAQYLPTTSLDPGMRQSTANLFSYAGYVLAVALALSAAGLSLERVAWIASALSVGIGFGLQAVVQNFVSGLILLAERPVRVGDWVSLGGVEGDIRRINVRATEIQMSDRSTVIVPNSEFITKVVRNVTHANPLGLVQIKLPMPLSTDAERVRSLIVEIFRSHDDVLDEPAPKVLLDGIDPNHGLLVFNATGYVNSPRAAYGVRSALLFEVLKQLGQANLPLSKPSTIMMMQPETPALPDTGAAMPPAPA